MQTKLMSLTLKKYKGLILRNIQEFTITPESPLQLILGTNGSGKTSILKMITPLPAHHTMFFSGGSKTSIWVRGENTFKLVSDFKDGNKHYFYINDGDNLNTGHTITVQRELVREYFGMTPEIHEMLMSEDGFHKMRASERKYWITKLATENYEYAISRFNKLNEKKTMISGAIKVNKKKLLAETASLMNDEEYSALQNEVNSFIEFVDALHGCRQKVTPTHLIENSIQLNIDEIYKLIDNFNKLNNKLSMFNVDKYLTGKKNFELSIVDQLNKKAVLENKINTVTDQYKKLEQTIELFNNNKETDSEDIRKNIKLYENLITTIEDSLRVKYKTETKAVNIKNAYDSCIDVLLSVFNELPKNENKFFSRQNFETAKSRIEQLKIQQKALANQLTEHQRIKETQEYNLNNHQVSCPNCEHEWAVGFDKQTYEFHLNQLESKQEQLDEVTILICEAEEYISSCTSYFSTYKQLSTTMQAWPVLKPLWDYILENEDIYNEPKNILHKLQAFQLELNDRIKIDSYKEILATLHEQLKQIIQINSDETKKVIEQGLSLEKELGDLTHQLTINKRLIADLEGFKATAEYLIQCGSNIENILQQINNNTDRALDSYRNNVLEEMIRSTQLVLAAKQNTLVTANNQKAIIDNLTNQIADLQKTEEALIILTKELSPVTGLIADGMFGSINKIINMINSFIKAIWTYELELQPCVLDEEKGVELDYVFPLKINGNIVDDISIGSKAQREIIDLAFKIVAMNLLGLNGYPLLLDEFGASFDASHREEANGIIKTLIEEHVTDQLFIISHYENNYGSLTNADICVLCDSNVVLPKGSTYNKHVVMK